MVGPLSFGDKPFLIWGEDVLQCGGDGVGYDFGNDAIDGVTDGYRACVFDEERVIFGKEVKEAEVEARGGGVTFGKIFQYFVDDLANVWGEPPEDGEWDAVGPCRGVAGLVDEVDDGVNVREGGGEV